MGFIRSFDGFSPPARFDSIPFTHVEVQESGTKVGPWEAIDTLVLDPLDTTPEEPIARDLTTSEAALPAPAWYRLVWKDVNENEFAGDPVEFEPLSEDLATVQDVMSVLRLDEIDENAEADLLRALATASSWARRYLRDPDLGTTGLATESYFGSTSIPYSGTVVSVFGVPFPGDDPVEITSDNYQDQGDRIRILSANWVWPGLPQDERRLAERIANWEIRVTTNRTSTVDPVIREAVAHAAAALWTRGPRLGKGLTGESIGDYSYTVKSLEAGDPFFEEAKVLLRPLIRRVGLVP